jgi:nucleoside-diphosphate-sugar epimerase
MHWQMPDNPKPTKVEANNRHLNTAVSHDVHSREAYKAVALDDLSLGTPHNLSKEVKFANGSVMIFQQILELTKEYDYVFHQAALSS